MKYLAIKKKKTPYKTGSNTKQFNSRQTALNKVTNANEQLIKPHTHATAVEVLCAIKVVEKSR